jgi:hypothetical protein
MKLFGPMLQPDIDEKKSSGGRQDPYLLDM